MIVDVDLKLSKSDAFGNGCVYIHHVYTKCTHTVVVLNELEEKVCKRFFTSLLYVTSSQDIRVTYHVLTYTLIYKHLATVNLVFFST